MPVNMLILKNSFCFFFYLIKDTHTHRHIICAMSLNIYINKEPSSHRWQTTAFEEWRKWKKEEKNHIRETK